MKAQQLTAIPRFGPQQVPAVPLQAATIPAQVDGGIGLDINSIMNLMITMMIVLMMMKMMTGAMGSLS